MKYLTSHLWSRFNFFCALAYAYINREFFLPEFEC